MIEPAAAPTIDIEQELDEADRAAAADRTRYTDEEVFSGVKERLQNKQAKIPNA